MVLRPDESDDTPEPPKPEPRKDRPEPSPTPTRDPARPGGPREPGQD